MHPVLVRIGEALRATTSRKASLEGDPARAAVALAFREDREEPELLFIRRATREGDPWSGQIALPGGRWSPSDADLEATALRETLEETGLDVRASGAVIGVLDELRPITPTLPPIIVAPYVAIVRPPGDLVLSDEVAAAFWVPWSLLTHPEADVESEVTVRGATFRTSSLVLGEHIVWGMTERILRQLFFRIRDR
jgi:8-oxo-dGTP pyrophosphatase MutT (NUDIX family)